MTTPIAMREGNCVRHKGEKFVGQHAGFTRLGWLMELEGDLRGVRVQLPDGTIKVASERNLERVDPAEYERYATSLGVVLPTRRPRADMLT
jgi:hypothetical protein